MEVTIERILPGGLGLAHADGRTVMVALAAPGDRVRVSIDRKKGSVTFASIDEVLEAAPVRVEPPCQYFGRCGGCDFQQMSYEAQLAAKVEIIKDCLRRIGRMENAPDLQITPAPNPWHYRTRAQWQYDSIRKRLGYFESGSRRVCDVVECAVLAPALQQTLSGLRARMLEGSLSDDARDFRAVVGDQSVSLAPQPGGNPTVREGADPKLNSESVLDIIRSIHGERYQSNAESFFQANDDLLPQLIECALKEAHGETAVELYCGVGLFTIPLARRFGLVIGIEGDTAATGFARANLAAAGATNAEIENGDVADWLKNRAESAQPPPLRSASALHRIDFLLLDPPRTGAESRVIAGILNLKPRHISYVSCDPATLARDLKKLLAGGYTLDYVAAFDMFPQTHHVETVVHLTG